MAERIGNGWLNAFVSCAATHVQMVPESKFQQRNVFELLCGGQSQYFQAPNTAEWCVSTRTLRDLKKCTRRIKHASSSHLWLCRVYYILDMLKKRQGEVESTNRCANTRQPCFWFCSVCSDCMDVYTVPAGYRSNWKKCRSILTTTRCCACSCLHLPVAAL